MKRLIFAVMALGLLTACDPDPVAVNNAAVHDDTGGCGISGTCPDQP